MRWLLALVNSGFDECVHVSGDPRVGRVAGVRFPLNSSKLRLHPGLSNGVCFYLANFFTSNQTGLRWITLEMPDARIQFSSDLRPERQTDLT